MLRTLLAVLATLPLAGCEFWQTPPPDPATDGLLSCGESQPLDGLVSGDTFAIDTTGDAGLVISTRFDDPAAAAILRIEADDVRQNLAEWWDPVASATRLTGSLESGQTATVDLFAAEGVSVAGRLDLACPAAETCWNLGDDNADGLADCADPQCARYPDCVAEQSDLETLFAPPCGDWIPVDPPQLSAIADQRTLYATFPLGEDQPVESWWGGAELRVPLTGVSAISARADVAGMLCVGAEPGASVICEEVALLGPGVVATAPATAANAWLEPLGGAWAGLEIQLACDAIGR